MSMFPPSEPSADSAFHLRRRRRASRACDFCRQKRIKCTIGQHPCMNCILYAVKCVYSDAAKPPGGGDMPTSSPPKRRKQIPVALPTSGELVTPQTDTMSYGQALLEQSGSDLAESVQGLGDEANFRPGQHVSHPYQSGETVAAASLSPVVDPNTGNESFTPINYDQCVRDLGLMPAWNTNFTFPSPPTMSDSQNIPQSSSSLLDSRHADNDTLINLDSLIPQDGEGTRQSLIPQGLFMKTDRLESRFLGMHSTGAAISTCLKDSIQYRSGFIESDSLDCLVEAIGYMDEVNSTEYAIRKDYYLPDKAFAAHGVKGYFRNLHLLYPVIDADQFQARWTRLYSSLCPDVDHIYYSCFYLIVAAGALSEPPPPGTEFRVIEEQSKLLHQHAWVMFDKAIAKPHTSSVQVILLHVIYLVLSGKTGIAWVVCGLAIRISQAIGLHRRSSIDSTWSEAHVRLRSRLWWVGYSLDAFLSATEGRPTATTDSSSDVELYPLVLEECALENAGSLASDLYSWHTQLARIENRLCGLLDRSETATARLRGLGEVDRALLSWRDSIPMEYRPDQENLAPRQFYHFVSLLHLKYFNMLRAVHWAALISVREDISAVSSEVSPRMQSSEAICVTSARSFVKTLNDLYHDVRQEKRVPISFHTSYYMAAISILFRNVFKNPQHLSARADLEYLRAARLHLQRNIDARSINCRFNLLFDKMERAAEQVLANVDK